ncbi:magnesium transporter CorA family protein [Acidithiobacillus ferriphilus]|jgi:Mg2+ and Co2+ transporters|uniref:Magnesium transporter n=1 Tax=Acidithiobacillus ferrivorans TaxID=160808 RepID=A0A257TB40_9PROT|nr:MULTISPECIES: magnesium transporter CorA family protein [Acidithiobacillus]OYV81881.1 MAG: magnesium transporter [Acidithiobacillus ferrivorans]MBU2785280.1 magnesium transporter CorA family protein [Acidithiobacillus ferriphilus]MBU2828917.1 magnesium transporter CorA family protein [Acidithiobacillus ferriphilus]MBU2829660.1 magnesium transporter CorA family protein [Acidithiobacillus ferriphilus]MBU2847050.1 magnesium transporter CorA family protein [Acidithiobacillus ferriphilus]
MLHWFNEKTDAELKVTADFEWPPSATWIQVVAPTSAELDFVAKHLQVPDYLFQDVSDEDERPRLEREGDIVLIILKVPAPMQAAAELHFRTLPVGLWLLPQQMVTASAQPLALWDELRGQRQRGKPLHVRGLLAEIFQAIARDYLRALRIINTEIAATEKILRNSQNNNEFFRLLALNKSLILFSSALKGNISVAQQTMRLPLLKQGEGDLEDIADALIDLQQARDMTEIYASTITNMMDAYVGVLQNNISNTLKIITAWTVVVAAPATVASIYGMNVPLPLQNWTYAWPVLMGGGFAISGMLFMIFRKRDWI